MMSDELQKAKEQIKVLITALLDSEHLSEAEQDSILDEVEKLSPDPAISDYIFWEDDLTIDEIIEKAFSYKPIILGDHSKDED